MAGKRKAPGERPGTRDGRTKIDWGAARMAFVSDPMRGFGKIARRFGVSDVAVGKRAKREGWQAEADKFDREAEARALKAAVKSSDERRDLYLRATDLAFAKAVEKLLSDEMEVKLSDLPALGKHAELLTGGDTDRIAIGEAQAWAQAWASALIRYVSAFIPLERRQEFITGLPELMPGAPSEDAGE